MVSISQNETRNFLPLNFVPLKKFPQLKKDIHSFSLQLTNDSYTFIYISGIDKAAVMPGYVQFRMHALFHLL